MWEWKNVFVYNLWKQPQWNHFNIMHAAQSPFYLFIISSIIKLYDFVWQNSIRSNGLYVFLNSSGDPCSLSKFDLLEEKNWSCLLHNLLYMDVLLIFTLTIFHQICFSIFCYSVTNKHPNNDLTIISKLFL